MASLRVMALSFVPFACFLTEPADETSPDSIERVGELRVARSVHTATTLASGQVLIVGGMVDAGGAVASVEMFDPATNGTREVSALKQARLGHTATLLGDGRVIIAGGFDGTNYLATVEVFDPTAQRLTSAGTLREGRSGHTATLLPDGRVLIVGGVGTGWTFLQSAEVYDPATGRSAGVGAMSVPRESHTATLLRDGRVLIVGGHTGRRENMTVHGTAEAFSPETGRFEPAGAMVIARHKHDAIRLEDGRVLVIGGADRTDRNYFASTELYDPTGRRFTSGPSMRHTRYKIAGTSVLLDNGDVLVTSGARAAERLDVRQLTFRAVSGALPRAYHFAAATTLGGDNVVFTGGYSDGNRNTAGVWRFRPQRASPATQP